MATFFDFTQTIPATDNNNRGLYGDSEAINSAPATDNNNRGLYGDSEAINSAVREDIARAEAAADAAEASAIDALASELAAQTAQGLAEDAQVAAETARDEAISAGGGVNVLVGTIATEHVLPAVTEGLQYVIVAGADAIQTVTPDAGDRFLLPSGDLTTLGNSLVSADLYGSMVKLTGIGETTWLVELLRGTWDWS